MYFNKLQKRHTAADKVTCGHFFLFYCSGYRRVNFRAGMTFSGNFQQSFYPNQIRFRQFDSSRYIVILLPGDKLFLIKRFFSLEFRMGIDQRGFRLFQGRIRPLPIQNIIRRINFRQKGAGVDLLSLIKINFFNDSINFCADQDFLVGF